MGKGKTITLTDSKSDKELVDKITKYQRSKGKDSFVQAVRDLCDTALAIEKIKRK
ncbi:MAG: hypothetical protein K6F91_09025 [Ruminococcus sp.]|nr:hypothetical protein [Ruminococcus sp.]